jgi:hypothetical protein
MDLKELESLQALHEAYKKHAPLRVSSGPLSKQVVMSGVDVCSCGMVLMVHNDGNDAFPIVESPALGYLAMVDSWRFMQPKFLVAIHQLDAVDAVKEQVLRFHYHNPDTDVLDRMCKLIKALGGGIPDGMFRQWLAPHKGACVKVLKVLPLLRAQVRAAILEGDHVRAMYDYCKHGINGCDSGVMAAAEKLCKAKPHLYDSTYTAFKNWHEARMQNYGG